jgi:hypothetical protein
LLSFGKELLQAKTFKFGSIDHFTPLISELRPTKRRGSMRLKKILIAKQQGRASSTWIT